MKNLIPLIFLIIHFYLAVKMVKLVVKLVQLVKPVVTLAYLKQIHVPKGLGVLVTDI
ncbi:MAG: hypothetical protein RIC06_22470 [Cyclobacteriaceae bacterium]